MANKSILDIPNILNEYCQEVQTGLSNVIIETAEKACAELRQTSPINKRSSKHRGRYRKGWKVDKTIERGNTSCVVYNKTDAQLTHLLERPHSVKNQYGEWGTSKPQVHIEPVNDKYQQQLITETERMLESIK